MKRNLDRRQFLKSSLSAAGAFFVASTPLKVFANEAPNTLSETPIDAKLLYTQAKDFFYKKQYTQASQLYRELIRCFPDQYVYYDGYARVLGAEQKLLETAELYREGWLQNGENPYFMQRLALRMYDICMGNRKAEREFCQKYGETVLFETAAELLLQAKKIKPKNEEFSLNLLDILKAVDTKNELLEKERNEQIDFSTELRNEMKTKTLSHESKWASNRASRKPQAAENVDRQIEKIGKQNRRNFHYQKERDSFDKSIGKARKNYRKQAFETGLRQDNANRVERYVMAILEEDRRDTDTIGKARKYYRKTGRYDKIITLNRYLYLKENSPANTLALASSLVRYGKIQREYNEAKELLSELSFYIGHANSIYAASYYISSAQACAKTNEPEAAKNHLLKGLERFENTHTGISYTLLEQYANIVHAGNKKSEGKDLLKTLSKKPSLAVDSKKRTNAKNEIWKYADNYVAKTSGMEQNPAEELKPLKALLKMHNEKSKDYKQIVTEINLLKIES